MRRRPYGDRAFLTGIVCAAHDQRSWETWLRKHHASSDGVWLLIAKRGAERPTVSYAEALETALCFDWIDGQKKRLDAQHWLQRCTPRRAH